MVIKFCYTNLVNYCAITYKYVNQIYLCPHYFKLYLTSRPNIVSVSGYLTISIKCISNTKTAPPGIGPLPLSP